MAVLIFALAALPLYYAISYGSGEEIQLDKIAIANKILESFRDEVKNLDFETVKAFGSSFDGRQLPPNSFQKLLDAQEKYKDFKFQAQSERKIVNEIETLNISAEVKWTVGSGGRESSQKISFIKVK